MNRKERLTKVVFILNGFVFTLGAFSYFDQKKFLFALLQVITAGLNILALINYKNLKVKYYLTYLILFFNIISALSISYDLFSLGKKYIQYMWIFVALVTTFAFIFQYKKDKSFRA